jgi:hypothetical protein
MPVFIREVFSYIRRETRVGVIDLEQVSFQWHFHLGSGQMVNWDSTDHELDKVFLPAKPDQ